MRKTDANSEIVPDCHTLELMFALEENKLHLQSVQASQRAHWQINFECSYKLISELTDDPIEIYWLCRNMTVLLTNKRCLVPNLVSIIQTKVFFLF